MMRARGLFGDIKYLERREETLERLQENKHESLGGHVRVCTVVMARAYCSVILLLLFAIRHRART